jgi:hypothetical protein
MRPETIDFDMCATFDVLKLGVAWHPWGLIPNGLFFYDFTAI